MDTEAYALNVSEAKTTREQQKADKQIFQRLEVIKWLNPPDTENHFDNINHMREDGTGEWLLASALVRDWLASSQHLIWIKGIPG
jgi:hypothetical protein